VTSSSFGTNRHSARSESDVTQRRRRLLTADASDAGLLVAVATWPPHPDVARMRAASLLGQPHAV